MSCKNAVAVAMTAFTMSVLAYAPRTYNVWSKAMGKNVPVAVLLPKGYDDDHARRYPLVVLLHGAGDTDMHAHHPLFREAVDRYQFILVAPCGTGTWWIDSPINPSFRYETFVVDEMLPWVDSHYRTIPDRLHRGLVGNSMGGHGALYLALRHKDLFSSAGNIFGCLDLWPWRDKGRWELRERLGDPLVHPEYWKGNSVVNLAKDLMDGEIATFTAVGQDDMFIGCNREFHATLAKNGVKHLYLEKDGGHSQGFWEEMYPKMLCFLDRWFRTNRLELPADSPTVLQPVLHGDGVQDDTDAIQAMLDSGKSCIYLPPPEKEYLISRTLIIGDEQELRLDRFTRVRLAPNSDCPMAANRDVKNGNRHIAITGGIWDFDNLHQGINFMHRNRDTPPQSEYKYGQPYHPWLYRGNVFYFENVKDMVVRGLTIRNPVTYAMQFCRLSYFVIDEIELDFTTWRPFKANMDGLHFDGGCHHGKISNIRGTAFDDMVALNANDGRCAAHEEPITDIDINGIYCEYCHSAVRLLSTGAAIKRVNISNVHGNFYRYAIGFTHFFDSRQTHGVFDAVTISNCHMAKCPQPEDLFRLAPFPVIYFDDRIDVGTVTIRDITREEHYLQDPTIGVAKGCSIDRLIVRDASQVNMTDKPIIFLHTNGKIGELVRENIRFVAMPGSNMDFDDKTEFLFRR